MVFCQNAVISVFSPFILYDIFMEVNACMSRGSHNMPVQQMQANMRNPILNSLMQRCLQMYVLLYIHMCIVQRYVNTIDVYNTCITLIHVLHYCIILYMYIYIYGKHSLAN